ncbi:peptidoglycan-binding domain-containing protein [Geminicoccaceae bacterium 1502E]|nr:peptidoglycan-binding domain-containing protein [Geminicoccaceae bacterium 1502E]
MRRLSCTTLTAAAVVVALSAPSSAADRNGAFDVRGLGSLPCSEINKTVEEKRQGDLVLVKTWLDGYFSATNKYRSGVFDALPWQSDQLVMNLVLSNCAEKPEIRIGQMAEALLEFFESQRLAEKSPLVEAKVGEKTVTLYSAILRRAQEALIKAGHLSGSADGAFGPKTRAGFESFQEKTGLAKTGLPDQETLVRLFVDRQGNPG